jgi:hypothetical protein
MITKNYYILFPLILILISYGCKSSSNKSKTSQTTENIDVNSPDQQDKEKLLDMALQIRGETLEPDKRALAIRMLSLNEKDLIRGLTQWLILLDGRYPDTLDPKVAIKLADRLLSARYGTKEQAKEHTYDVFFASTFYDKLVREKKDVVYYGDKVTPKDKDKILIRWKIKKDKYHVIFGNLRVEDVSSDMLAKLET